MSFLRMRLRCFMALLLCLSVGGCFPSGRNPSDEQKEPHFLTGKSRVASMDYKGAVEAFEKALEVNPRSASAHFELGLLYEKNEMDYAAAIYHFDRFLRLRQNSEYAEIVKQRMLACKQELAKTVSLGPVTQSMQHDLERLTAENRDLHQRLVAWQAYYAGGAQAPTNPPSFAPVKLASTGPSASTQNSQLVSAPSNQSTADRRAAAAPAKTHIIKTGETAYSIARKYGVKLDALLTANPGIDPKRLQVGQTLNVPAP